jgi:predicted ribosomally synthesized peptide with SipW-like signal peptide
MSKGFTKVLSAGLLTVAVVGGAVAYMTDSLKAKPVSYSADGVVTEQAAQPATAKVVTVTDMGRSS